MRYLMRLLGKTAWHFDAHTGLMWRWTPGGWESRPPTEEEALDAAYWQAIR